MTFRWLRYSGRSHSPAFWTRLLCVVAAMSLAFAARAGAPEAPPAPNSSNIFELRIDGEIEPILAEYLVNGIDEANREHASLILITIDTPGGLDTAMRSIIQAILQSKVPVVNY